MGDKRSKRRRNRKKDSVPPRATTLLLSYLFVALGVFVVPGALLSLSWFEEPTDPTRYADPTVLISMRTAGDTTGSHQLSLYHQVQLKYEGEEYEVFWAYFGQKEHQPVSDIEVYLDPGSWTANSWSCYTINAVEEGETTLRFDTLGDSSAHVAPEALEQPETPVGEYKLHPGSLAFKMPGHSFEYSFPIEASSNAVGVGCRRTGELSPEAGAGRRIFAPSKLIVENESGGDIVANLSELVSFPGEWVPGEYWSTASRQSTVGWEAADLDGTQQISDDEPVIGVAWNDGWYSDPRLLRQEERKAWVGALMLGAGLGAILALLAPPSLPRFRRRRSKKRSHSEDALNGE